MTKATSTPPRGTPKVDRQRELMAAQGYMLATEAAERSGYDISHIYGLLKPQGDKPPKVHGVRVGERGWYVQRSSLVEYIGQEASAILGLDKPLDGERVITDLPDPESNLDDLLDTVKQVRGVRPPTADDEPPRSMDYGDERKAAPVELYPADAFPGEPRG